jgi:hypothetical protein
MDDSMPLRLVLLSCCFCLGCHSIRLLDRDGTALGSWEKGQDAMRRGETDQAIAHYEEGLAKKQPEARLYLSLAAAYVAKGDETSACVALERFVEENPAHRNSRLYLAELLHRAGKDDEARSQFEHVVSELQQDTKCDYARLIHCHGRLMELADEQEDEYGLHLHRGIGLYWLAQSTRLSPEEGDEWSPEGLLCKAAGELSLARFLRPDEARPSWYLYGVWRDLGQNIKAKECLSAARDAADFTFLTPAEQRGLQLAGTTPLFR